MNTSIHKTCSQPLWHTESIFTKMLIPFASLEQNFMALHSVLTLPWLPCAKMTSRISWRPGSRYQHFKTNFLAGTASQVCSLQSSLMEFSESSNLPQIPGFCTNIMLRYFVFNKTTVCTILALGFFLSSPLCWCINYPPLWVLDSHLGLWL